MSLGAGHWRTVRIGEAWPAAKKKSRKRQHLVEPFPLPGLLLLSFFLSRYLISFGGEKKKSKRSWRHLANKIQLPACEPSLICILKWRPPIVSKLRLVVAKRREREVQEEETRPFRCCVLPRRVLLPHTKNIYNPCWIARCCVYSVRRRYTCKDVLLASRHNKGERRECGSFAFLFALYYVIVACSRTTVKMVRLWRSLSLAMRSERWQSSLYLYTTSNRYRWWYTGYRRSWKTLKEL